MRISELIKELEQTKKIFGDIEVYHWKESDNNQERLSVTLAKKDGKIILEFWGG